MAQVVDARVLRDAMARYLEALRAHREEIDSLNVFPVPDGDTGTNLLLTQQAVEAALARLPSEDLGMMGEAISRSSLMGARGNSGVILSQALRGLCARLCREVRAGPRDLAEALAEAAEEARGAVADPVEGTMLSVLRDAAGAAQAACRDGAGCDDVADAALAAGLASLQRTRDELPALTEAGVVDAGARGLVLLLDALVSAIRGVPLQVAVGPRGPVGDGNGRSPAPASDYGFEVMYLLACDESAVGSLRERLGSFGDSLVLVGGDGLYTVHVHTDDPDRAVEEARAAGTPSEIRMTSLDEQVEACLAGEARAVRAGASRAPMRTSVLAVVPTEGVARLFRSLGAAAVVAPSETELAEAISGSPGGVIVLPTDPGTAGVAERAVARSGRPGRVPATRSIPEGLAAATAVLADDDPEANAARAEAAFRGVASTVSAGDDLVEAVRAIHRDRHEVATLLAGRGVSDGRVERAAEELRRAFPGLEVEWHRGDQPDHPFVIGLE